MSGENWVLLALIAATAFVKITALVLRHAQAKRRDQNKTAATSGGPQ